VIADRAVVDASVLVRAGVEDTTSARDWLESVESGRTEALAPEILWLEVASVLRRYVASAAMSRSHAGSVLRRMLALPIHIYSHQALAEPALDRALGRGLSVYDASYLALAEVAHAVVITADRRLAEAAEQAELVV
jgi:predicted nucleic acid-binding protein